MPCAVSLVPQSMDMSLHYVRGCLKTAAKLLVAVFSSFAAAFVWWACFPEPPPLPDQLLLAFEPIVIWLAETFMVLRSFWVS